GGHGLTRVLVEIGHDHAHALGREPLGDPRADPVRASGYQGGRTCQVHSRSLRRSTDSSPDCPWRRPRLCGLASGSEQLGRETGSANGSGVGAGAVVSTNEPRRLLISYVVGAGRTGDVARWRVCTSWAGLGYDVSAGPGCSWTGLPLR